MHAIIIAGQLVARPRLKSLLVAVRAAIDVQRLLDVEVVGMFFGNRLNHRILQKWRAALWGKARPSKCEANGHELRGGPSLGT